MEQQFLCPKFKKMEGLVKENVKNFYFLFSLYIFMLVMTIYTFLKTESILGLIFQIVLILTFSFLLIWAFRIVSKMKMKLAFSKNNCCINCNKYKDENFIKQINSSEYFVTNCDKCKDECEENKK